MSRADLVREWLEYAFADLRTAKHLFETLHPRPLEIVCYHCQQTAEKALKGFLINQDFEPPRTHDLEMLYQLCAKLDQSFETIRLACQSLTNYATSTRYPSNVEIEESNATLALKQAESIYNLCSNLVIKCQTNEQEQTIES